MLVSLAWVLFRANNLSDAGQVLAGIFTRPGMPDISFAMFTELTLALFALGILLVKELCDENGWRPALLRRRPTLFTPLYLVVIAAYLLLFGVLGGDQFIYFQF